ncbi:MAG: hypothetical protein M3460_07095, partial [Actinomycetota bacterium]|nr:hypothetical protein [Actinomycetota bacterium]
MSGQPPSGDSQSGGMMGADLGRHTVRVTNEEWDGAGMTTGRLLSDRYELGETLGYGGMSEVHRGG